MIGLMMLAVAATGQCAGPVDPYRDAEPVIPSEKPARAIASAYIVNRFGQASLDRQLPLNVTAQADTWTVAGTLPNRRDQISIGGVAQIILCRENGRVLRFTVSQ